MEASNQLGGHCSHLVNHGGGLGGGGEEERPELSYIWKDVPPDEGHTLRLVGAWGGKAG